MVNKWQSVICPDCFSFELSKFTTAYALSAIHYFECANDFIILITPKEITIITTVTSKKLLGQLKDTLFLIYLLIIQA